MVDQTMSDVDQTPDVLKLAQDQFLPLCQSWDYEDWDEYDYGRIKSLKFRELEDARKKLGETAVSKESLKCPNFLKHVSCRLVQPIGAI